MDVSVVIINWNTRDILRNCLISIFANTKNVEFEVIVIDNASSDGSVDMLKSEFPQVVSIENSVNRGYAVAVNQGIAVAKGRYVLALNSDIIICDNAIEKTIRYADKHLEAAVIGCQVWEDSDTIQTTCFRFPNAINLFLLMFGLAKIFKYNRVLGRERMLWWNRKSERQVDVISGSFMLVRQEAIEQVGGMDEDYFLYYEETDWCYRFKQAGWEMRFWPGAKIIHDHGGRNSSKQEAVKMYVQMQKSCFIFFKKQRNLVSCISARLIMSLSLALRLCFWSAALLIKYICSDTKYEKQKVEEVWAAFNYCVFGIEPKD